ncbi:MAG: hypothetical protein WCJ40_14655 [Planctomycetota bacterium]
MKFGFKVFNRYAFFIKSINRKPEFNARKNQSMDCGFVLRHTFCHHDYWESVADGGQQNESERCQQRVLLFFAYEFLFCRGRTDEIAKREQGAPENDRKAVRESVNRRDYALLLCPVAG